MSEPRVTVEMVQHEANAVGVATVVRDLARDLLDSRAECARLRERVAELEKDKEELIEAGKFNARHRRMDAEHWQAERDKVRQQLAEADAALLYTWGHDDTASLDATVRAAVSAARARQAKRDADR